MRHLLKKASKPLNKILVKLTGYELVNRKIRVINYKSYQFYVPINRCYNGYAFGYNSSSFHPLTALLREYEKNPSLTYEDSIVSKFSEKYKPNNLQEALYGETFDRDCRTAQISFTHGFSVFRVPIVPMPWSSDSNIDFYYSGKWAKTDSGRTHFRRTIETYESIKNHGFNPDEYSDGSLQHGYIRIVILKSGNDCRFVITGGQHRVAALATLGWEEIPVIFEHHFLASPPVVDIKNLDHWPVVRRGIYDKKAAYRVFEAFFTDQSRLKLEKLGLIY